MWRRHQRRSPSECRPAFPRRLPPLEQPVNAAPYSPYLEALAGGGTCRSTRAAAAGTQLFVSQRAPKPLVQEWKPEVATSSGVVGMLPRCDRGEWSILGASGGHVGEHTWRASPAGCFVPGAPQHAVVEDDVLECGPPLHKSIVSRCLDQRIEVWPKPGVKGVLDAYDHGLSSQEDCVEDRDHEAAQLVCRRSSAGVLGRQVWET